MRIFQTIFLRTPAGSGSHHGTVCGLDASRRTPQADGSALLRSRLDENAEISESARQGLARAFTFYQLRGVSTIECHWSGQYTLIVPPNFACAIVSVSLLWFQLADPGRPGLAYRHALERQLAVMHLLVRFANIAASGRFTAADLWRGCLFHDLRRRRIQHGQV